MTTNTRVLKVLILGANGFIGHHLSKRILDSTPWEIHAMDLASDRLTEIMDHPRFRFFQGDITVDLDWVQRQIKNCDVVLPLVAIATPSTYVTDPLRVFELDFEANLPIVRAAAQASKRVVFPSTSEVYGMSDDDEFDPETSKLVYGPIHKTRWIYACSKQLMDRVIAAYGQQWGLRYTLFRPFNWIGPGLDKLDSTHEGSSRVVTRFLNDIHRGGPITLVDGGAQRRSFTAIEDGLDALMAILSNPNGVADGKVYNIGNPANDVSIAELAIRMIAIARDFPPYHALLDDLRVVSSEGTDFYGPGYQDMSRRVPSIRHILNDLGWRPRVGLDDALRRVIGTHLPARITRISVPKPNCGGGPD